MEKSKLDYFKKGKTIHINGITFPCEQRLSDDNFVLRVGTSYPASMSSNEGHYPSSAMTYLHIIDLAGKNLVPYISEAVDGRTEMMIEIKGGLDWFIGFLKESAKVLEKQSKKDYLARIHEYAKHLHPGADPVEIEEEERWLLTRHEGFKPIRTKTKI